MPLVWSCFSREWPLSLDHLLQVSLILKSDGITVGEKMLSRGLIKALFFQFVTF